jgi:hypothetical protein
MKAKGNNLDVKNSYSKARSATSAPVFEFPLVEKFQAGYRNREDITTLPPGIMVVGSQNVLTNVSQRVAIRRGYTLDGQRDTSRNPIISAFDWERHSGNTLHLRAGYDYTNNAGKLQFRYVAQQDGERWDGHVFVKNEVYWIDLLTGLSSSSFNFADFWDFNTELKDFLLFVNGEPRINEWTGGVAVLKSVSNAAGSIASYEQIGAVQTVSVGSGGFGYDIGDLLTLSVTGGGTAVVEVVGTAVGGQVTGISIVAAGSGYATGNGQIGTGGRGNGFTANVTAVSSVAGNGYAIGDTLTIATGSGNATIKVTNVTASGAIVAFVLTNPGTGYSTGVKNTTTAGSGVNATFSIASVATGYIEKYGDASWNEEGFYNLNAQRAVMINGTSYSYTGGEATTFLVGISPDASGEPLKSVIFQTPQFTLNSAMKGLPSTIGNVLIANLKNQIYIASSTDRSVYVSKVNNYKDYTFTSPVRIVGEGAVMTLDGFPISLIPQQTDLYISAGKDQWYTTEFKLSADNTAETLTVQRLKTTSHQGAQSQAMCTKIKNYIAYVSNEPIVNTLGIDQNFLLDPRVTDLSGSIVNDMQEYDFTGGSISYFPGSITQPGTYLFVFIPRNSTVRIYNMTDVGNPYWEAPQIIPATCSSIIDGELYIHSSQSSNTFRMFNGYNDDGHAVSAVAAFSFNNSGVRTVRKSSTACYVEGYIAANTTLTLNLQRDLDGIASNYSTNINGVDNSAIPPPPDTASLGKTSLGKNSLGGEDNFTAAGARPPKFRVEKTYNRVEYFEEQVSFSSYGTDQIWEILAFGTNATPSLNEPTDIRE